MCILYYYCSTLQELKQETELVNETKTLLEQKAATLAARAEAADELQSEIASLRVRLGAVNQVGPPSHPDLHT